jgi:hypothetical protein
MRELQRDGKGEIYLRKRVFTIAIKSKRISPSRPKTTRSGYCFFAEHILTSSSLLTRLDSVFKPACSEYHNSAKRPSLNEYIPSVLATKQLFFMYILRLSRIGRQNSQFAFFILIDMRSVKTQTNLKNLCAKHQSSLSLYRVG